MKFDNLTAMDDRIEELERAFDEAQLQLDKAKAAKCPTPEDCVEWCDCVQNGIDEAEEAVAVAQSDIDDLKELRESFNQWPEDFVDYALGNNSGDVDAAKNYLDASDWSWYESIEEYAQNMLENFGTELPPMMEAHVDFEAWGWDMLNSEEDYVQLESGIYIMH